MRTYVRMREYGYTVIEHDTERRWIVRERRHETALLDDEMNFFQWAAARYPHERFTVELDPSSLSAAELIH